MQNWFNVSHLSGVRISGPDAFEFCQAQFTTDFQQLNESVWQICAWCDPKGRCLAIILASIDEDHVDLVAPRSQAAVLNKLKMYAIGRKIEFSALLHVSGNLAPASSTGASRLSDDRAMRLDDEPADPASDQLRQWRIADLCLPLPWLNEYSTGRYLPQFLGLEENQGLSYRKGCFPGQEVIARVHYLGKVKHRLTGFVLDKSGNQAELDTGQLVIRGNDRTADILESVRIGNKLIGMAVCPAELAPDSEIEFHGRNGLLSGQMTEPKGLCYYRDINYD